MCATERSKLTLAALKSILFPTVIINSLKYHYCYKLITVAFILKFLTNIIRIMKQLKLRFSTETYTTK